MNSQGNKAAEEAQTWEKLDSWMCVLPPSRPAAYQLAFIQRWLALCQQTEAIGVLGSTPEFVDLLIELGFRNITLFEKFPAAYQRMSALRVHSAIERVVWGDWRQTLPQNRGRYKVLLSDLTSGNVPYADRSEFCDAVRTALVCGGFFIDRVLIGRPQPYNYESQIQTFCDQPINLITANRFNCEVVFTSTLASGDGIIDTTAFYNKIKNEFASRRLAKLLALVEKVTPKDCMWWYGRPWAELATSYFSNYRLLATVPEPEPSWYLGAVYMHLLQKEF